MDRLFIEYSKRAKQIDIEDYIDRVIIETLYKQATIGDCNTTEPSIIDQIKNSEWRIWKRMAGMPKEEAMKRYLDAIEPYI